MEEPPLVDNQFRKFLDSSHLTIGSRLTTGYLYAVYDGVMGYWAGNTKVIMQDVLPYAKMLIECSRSHILECSKDL